MILRKNNSENWTLPWWKRIELKISSIETGIHVLAETLRCEVLRKAVTKLKFQRIQICDQLVHFFADLLLDADRHANRLATIQNQFTVTLFDRHFDR